MNELIQFINSTSNLLVAKDINSAFVCISHSVAELMGWKSAKQAISKTDNQLPCKAADSAEDFINLDKLVLYENKKNLATLEVQPYAQGWKAMIAYRTPIYDKKHNIIGLTIIILDVSMLSFLNIPILLNEHFLGKKRQATYIINDNKYTLPLTEQQKICLFLLCKDKSIKEISRLLKLTQDKINGIIVEIKKTLSCNSHAELIEKTYTMGFHYYIPPVSALNSFGSLFNLEANNNITKHLSTREISCMQLLAEGKTAKQIAIQHHISPRTVEAYLDQARNKLNCANRTELVAQAIRLGIIK